MAAEKDSGNSSVLLELKTLQHGLNSALIDSEFGPMEQKAFSPGGSKLAASKKKTGLAASPTKTTAAGSKDSKVLVEEIKKVKILKSKSEYVVYNKMHS